VCGYGELVLQGDGSFTLAMAHALWFSVFTRVLVSELLKRYRHVIFYDEVALQVRSAQPGSVLHGACATHPLVHHLLGGPPDPPQADQAR
jgi:hypothetical protein